MCIDNWHAFQFFVFQTFILICERGREGRTKFKERHLWVFQDQKIPWPAADFLKVFAGGRIGGSG